MDPNHWANYNAGYGRLGPSGIPTSHPGLNFPILDQATITSGLGLTAGIPAHSGLSSRSLAGLPGPYHGHPVHNTVPQFFDPMNTLQAANFTGQSPYKPITSASGPFAFESPGVGYTGSRYSAGTPTTSSSGLPNASSKSSYFPSEKEQIASFASSQAVQDALESKWGLSNFVPFTDLSPPFSAAQSSQPAPPPAHSSGSSNRSASSRNPFPQDDFFSPKSTKTTVSSHSQSSSSSYISTSNPRSRSQEVEDLSSHSTPIYGSTGYSNISSNNYSSHLQPDMNYDPVSPVTPVSHSPPHQSSGLFNTVSLSDLKSIGSALDKSRSSSRKDLMMNEQAIEKLNKRMAKESSLIQHINSRNDRPVVNSPLPNMGSIPNIPMQKSSNIQNGKSNPSPMQQSPISVGSPQAPISMNSPQTSIPSTTYTPTPNPIQAVPDSTTKPKSRKPKKKKIESTPQYMPQEQFASSMNRSTPGNLNQPQFPQPPNSRSNNDTPLSPIRPMPGILGSPLGEELSSMHRIPSILEDAMSRHNSMSSVQDSSHNTMHTSSAPEQIQNISTHSSHPGVSPLLNSTPQSHLPVNQMMEANMLSRQAHEVSQRMFRGDPASMMAGSGMFSENELSNNQNQFDVNGYSGSTFLDDLNSHAEPDIENFTSGMAVDRENYMLDISGFTGGHYGMHPGMTAVEVANQMHLGTIDQSTFTSLLEQDMSKKYRSQESKLTCTIPVEMDDELACFSRPPPTTQPNPTPVQTKPKVSRPQNAFNESFINFVKGKKPETLSSVNNAPHKKPQLPKYIPEPPRPKVVRKPEPKVSSRVSFSEDDDSDSKMSKVVDDLLSDSENDSTFSAEYTVKKQKQSTKKVPPLVIKKKLIQTLPSKTSKPPKPKKRSFGKDYSVAVDPYAPVDVEVDTPRTLISRKAKDKAIEKNSTKKKGTDDTSVSGDSEPEYVPFAKKGRAMPTVDYDSDADPAWTPFALDLKDQSEDLGEIKPRKKRDRQRSGSGRSKQRSSSHKSRKKHDSSYSSDSFQEAPTIPSRSDQGHKSKPPIKSQSSKSNSRVPDENATESEEECFQVGRFIIEKKDLNNYETYPIWRIEQGGMIHKFENFPEDGTIRHKSEYTYTRWMPIMKNQFIPIRVKVITEKSDKTVVEVLDEYKPTPPSDGSLENMYEEDPLVDSFNVYLQIFLSQALEPSFLRAIKDSKEHFYLGPLDTVDKLIDRKLEEIDKKIKWKPDFKDCLKSRPSIKERDRPNLKQSCQACENSNPPTVKSLHLQGQPYDRFLLKSIPENTEASNVFMIGKLASQYAGLYHSLYHFKYLLYQRCLAKIRIIREGEPNISNEHILDQCLQNRAWVLKIFQDLKELLEKG
ncbi:hypothetical protein LOTGIDRAFT_153075 [Lottia gigantea]|uniref:DUF4211 domain-containing protein n=1 Tax=Lottia gigantea TaxID=225164 RepID=V4ASW7_LOTGI|nr:hypothetical protein LOTGIDRAFT_153075 [Lottia gigantea]ESO97965.1 hypothetical protein LOTGIDRAFT_153075 [Lottia gigantea]